MDPTTPTPTAFRERERTRVACVRIAGTLLACLCLLTPRFASRLVAEEEKPPSSSGQNGQTEGQPPDAKSREQKNKPPPQTHTGAKSAARPKPTPTPGAGQEPDASTASPSPGGAVAKPAPPAPTPDPVFRFDDFDLERFHRPVRVDEDPGDGEEAGAAAEPAGATVGATEAQAPRVKERPKPAAETPRPDPVKPSRNAEGPEMPRQIQVQAARQRIARLQARLEVLYAKRESLANPATPRAGESGNRNAPVRPSQPPPPVDVNKASARTPAVNALLRQVDDEIRAVEEEIEAAKSELASVEIRFAQESRTR
jgi:hypothetical protein